MAVALISVSIMFTLVGQATNTSCRRGILIKSCVFILLCLQCIIRLWTVPARLHKPVWDQLNVQKVVNWSDGFKRPHRAALKAADMLTLIQLLSTLKGASMSCFAVSVDSKPCHTHHISPTWYFEGLYACIHFFTLMSKCYCCFTLYIRSKKLKRL